MQPLNLMCKMRFLLKGHSPGDSSVPASERPPSSEDGRQDVILFHLDDHPIRTLVNWNSYEEMITEIAHHYGLRRDEVQEAYEIAVSPPDIGIEVVPYHCACCW